MLHVCRSSFKFGVLSRCEQQNVVHSQYAKVACDGLTFAAQALVATSGSWVAIESKDPAAASTQLRRLEERRAAVCPTMLDMLQKLAASAGTGTAAGRKPGTPRK